MAGGLVLIELTGLTFFDPVLAIVVAVLIMWTAWRMVSQSTRVLLDEALPDDELDIVRATVPSTVASSSSATTSCARATPAPGT